MQESEVEKLLTFVKHLQELGVYSFIQWVPTYCDLVGHNRTDILSKNHGPDGIRALRKESVLTLADSRLLALWYDDLVASDKGHRLMIR